MNEKRAGFTLIEVLVALSILSIIVVALSGMLTSSLQARQVSAERSTANRYAESLLNRYKGHWKKETNYVAASAPPNIPPVPEGFDSTIGLAIENRNYDGSVYTGTDAPDMRSLTVTLRRQGKVMANLSTEIGKPVTSR